VYNSSGLAYYRHSDWLGNSRFASTPARAMYFDGAYAPFGENYAQTGTTDLSFTGMNQDTVSNLFDFPAREYNGIHGRWPSPDPAGISSVRPRDPQTLNRYAYVRSNPLRLTDPTGLCPGDDGGDNGDGDDDGGDGDGGGDSSDAVHHRPHAMEECGGGTLTPFSPDPGAPDPGTTDPGTPDPGNPDPGTTDPNQGGQNQCDSSTCQTATGCNDSGCTNQTVMIVNGNAPQPDADTLNANALQIGNMVGNSFPNWVGWKGWQFSQNTCSWINLGVGFSGGVAFFSPEPVSKGIGIVGFVVTGGAAILGNCI
jgi:RHS repeat-associated protein